MRNALLPLLAGLALAGCDLDGRELLQNYDPETGESLPVTVVDQDRLDEPPVVCEADDVSENNCETFRGALGFSRVFIFSSCFTRLCTCDALEATERKRSMNSWIRSTSFFWFRQAESFCS